MADSGVITQARPGVTGDARLEFKQRIQASALLEELERRDLSWPVEQEQASSEG